MLGRDHAKSGAAAALVAADTIGLHPVSTLVPVVVLVAGYALIPDLDCDGSTATRLLGPVTRVLSWLLEHLSAVAYRVTATRHDQRSTGTHRHLTHTACFAALLGAAAQASAALSPWVVAAWMVFGVLGAAAAVGDWTLIPFAAALAIPPLVDHTPLLAILTHLQPWLGPAVTLGCLVHCLGDAITVTGVPLLWPIPIRRQTWHPIHLLPHAVRLHTGLRVERWVVAPLLTVVTVLAVPGVWPHLTALITPAAHAASTR